MDYDPSRLIKSLDTVRAGQPAASSLLSLAFLQAVISNESSQGSSGGGLSKRRRQFSPQAKGGENQSDEPGARLRTPCKKPARRGIFSPNEGKWLNCWVMMLTTASAKSEAVWWKMHCGAYNYQRGILWITERTLFKLQHKEKNTF